jgi:hypothetical protein
MTTSQKKRRIRRYFILFIVLALGSGAILLIKHGPFSIEGAIGIQNIVFGLLLVFDRRWRN